MHTSAERFWFSAGYEAVNVPPKDIIDKLNAAMAKSVPAPALKAKLEGIGVQTATMSPAEFDAVVKAELGTYAEFAKATGMKAN